MMIFVGALFQEHAQGGQSLVRRQTDEGIGDRRCAPCSRLRGKSITRVRRMALTVNIAIGGPWEIEGSVHPLKGLRLLDC